MSCAADAATKGGAESPNSILIAQFIFQILEKT
jgi:hypothetical protein